MMPISDFFELISLQVGLSMNLTNKDDYSLKSDLLWSYRFVSKYVHEASAEEKDQTLFRFRFVNFLVTSLDLQSCFQRVLYRNVALFFAAIFIFSDI